MARAPTMHGQCELCGQSRDCAVWNVATHGPAELGWNGTSVILACLGCSELPSFRRQLLEYALRRDHGMPRLPEHLRGSPTAESN